jgi:hypothetical protein
VRGEVSDVGVAPGDEVSACGGDGLVERLALPLAGAELRQHVVDADHPSAGLAGDAGRVVGGVVVHHEDLVHQSAAVHQHRADLLDDGADGRRLVARREAHAHDMAVASLGVGEGGGVEVAVPVGPEDGPPHGAIQPAPPPDGNLGGGSGMGRSQGWFSTIAGPSPPPEQLR